MKTGYRSRIILIMTVFSYAFALQRNLVPAVLLSIISGGWSLLLRRRQVVERAVPVLIGVLFHLMVLICFDCTEAGVLACAAAGTVSAMLWAGNRYEGMRMDGMMLFAAALASAGMQILVPSVQCAVYSASLFIPLFCRLKGFYFLEFVSGNQKRPAVQ